MDRNDKTLSLNPDRRSVLAGTGAVFVVGSVMSGPGMAAESGLSFYVGTYSSDTAKGIYPLHYAPKSDSWALGQVVPAVENASFGVFSSRTGCHYVADEAHNTIGVYRVENGAWTKLSEVSSQGAAPCYLSLDAAQSVLAVANYTGGDAVFYPIAKDGRLSAPTVRQNKGTGPNTDRQDGPHAHWVQFAPDQRHAYSIDLGTDQLLGYSFDAKTGAVGEAFVACQLPGGDGPRHMVFAPDGQHAFMITELSNHAVVLRKIAEGRFEIIQTLSTLPTDFTAHSQAAHIALNTKGDRLYISNRGHNSIAVFAVKAGRLSLLQIAPTLGNWPRFFRLVEAHKRLIVAHQNDDTLVVFVINADGTLTPKNQTLHVPKPVFIGAV